MKPVINSFLLLLPFFLSIAANRECYMCSGRNSVTCQQEIVNCTKGDKCVIISEEYKYNKTFFSVYKGCSRGLPCNQRIHGKVNDNLTLTYKIRCCDTDLCNVQFFEKPIPKKPTGYMCPSFLAQGIVEKSETKKKVQCPEKTDECFSYSGTIEKPDGELSNYTIRGCMSPAECKLNIFRMVGLRVHLSKYYECRYPEEALIDEKKKME
ncbi:hypothetical protein GDO81_019262 [Engystomops pustulosus]|uniref:UPAR/Ly6 domain-containing protein n=1 Tax=Engystomops pustulosus TaxID=76066 RepID=A0AAV6ZJD0_ENGPU|nr:hypothetical protein GDO81_019262 [Engystomops pustulosus]